MHPLIQSDQYRTIPFVVYHRLEPKKRAVRVNYVCFGQLPAKGVPSAIRYIAPINDTCCDKTKVADGAVEFYMEFMKRVLTRPESPRFLMKRIKNTIHYRLDTKGLSYLRALFFLTWFRYVHHYPEIVHKLYTMRKPEDTLEETFKNFFSIHNDYVNGKIRLTSVAAANELCMYNWGGKVEPISLEKLWKNMERASKIDMGVQACFK